MVNFLLRTGKIPTEKIETANIAILLIDKEKE
ncbi:hypothetical protein VHARVF571_90142 [Vibrio harveyi]|nr:hypothetical protein VHARVF571_90142 [Vibrio harveyi]